MDKDVRMPVAIARVDMLIDFLAHKADEIIRVGFVRKFLGHHVWVSLVFLERIVQERVVAKLLFAKILAEYLEQVELEGIHEIGGTLQIFLESLYLAAHFILLVGRVLVYVVVVEYIAAVLVLELWGT